MDPKQVDVEHLEEIFSIFDNRGDGKIEIKQVAEVLRAMGLNPTEADVRRYCEPLLQDNENKEKRIPFEVFMPIYQQISKTKDRYSFDDMVDGLRNFDTDGSGLIQVNDLRHLLTALGEKMTEDEVEQVIDPAMIDDDGKINYENFVRNIMNG